MDEVLIDYAYSLIRIRALTKEVDELLLKKNFMDAREKTLDMIVETRALSAAIRHMQLEEGERNALREQTKTVQERVPAAG